MNKSHRRSFLTVLLAIAAFCLCAVIVLTGCDSCDGDGDHTHVYSEEWSYDSNGHWHACTGDDCDSTSDYAEHVFDDGVVQTDGTYLYTCTVCGYQETSTGEIYQLTLTNMGGTVLVGVDVDLYSSAGSKVTSGTTGTSGFVRFRNLASATYVAYIDVDTLPAGYILEDNQVQLTAENKRVTLKIESALITGDDVNVLSGVSYSIGSVVYDFTVTCYNTDGTSYNVTLSEYLEDYGAVLLNFFYTTCNPCRSEMPYMQQAYNSFTDGIGLICFDYTGMGDTEALMRSFKGEYGLSFDLTLDSNSYYSCYSVSAYPTTIIIDRYGCVASIDTGSNVSAASWTNMFKYYTADDYTPNYASSSSSDDSSSSLTESTVEMPDSADIAAAINGTGTTETTFTYSNYMEDGVVDVYNWAWQIGTETKAGVDGYIYTSNKGIVGGYSIIVIDVTLDAGDAVLFDYIVSTEDDYDVFYVQVDTVLQATYSGDGSSWDTCLAYVARYSGDYQLTLYYQKDSSKDYYDDTVYVSNLRIVDTNDAETTLTGVSTDLLYNAATNYTDDTTIDLSDYGEGYGYLNYVSVYLASDGYYHVGSKADGADPEEDPFLLADLYYGTPWYNDMSIWYEVYDYAGEDSLEIFNSKLASAVKIGTAYEAFEDYSWAQNNCPWGYVPVNEELHDMLVAFVSTYGRKTGSYAYDNQWLELCRYYVHYGDDHSSGDECYSTDNIALTFGFRYAEDLGTVDAATQNSDSTALTFTAEMETLFTPRGYYYAITVSQSGIYRIYSYDFESNADAAPYTFLVTVGSDGTQTTLDESESDDLATVEGFMRHDVKGSLDLTSGTTLTFKAVYTATYQFTLSGDNISAAKILSSTEDGATTYLDASTATANSDGTYTFSLELTADEEYTFVLTGCNSAALAYEITDTSYDFGIYHYLEAGTTYYIATAYGSTEQTGSYEVGIYYIGEQFSYFTTLTTGAYYTYYESTDSSGNVSYNYYLPTRVGRNNYSVFDGYWYTVDANGDKDQLIYIDLVGTTWFNLYSSYTIENAVAANSTLGTWNSSQLAKMKNYLEQANANTDTVTVNYGSGDTTVSLNGCLPASEELASLVNILVNGGDDTTSTTYAANAWMLTAYYVRVIK